jgi:hypothetical protein
MRKTNQILNNQVFISINNFALKQKKSEEKSSDHDWVFSPLLVNISLKYYRVLQIPHTNQRRFDCVAIPSRT